MLRRLKKRLVNRHSPPTDPLPSDYPTLNSPLDYDLSPYTGWTRQHWEELTELVLRGVSGFFSPGRAEVLIPGPKAHHGADGLEGYARSLSVAAPWFVRQGGGKISHTVDLLDYYQTGLRHGTDPTHKEYWGDISDYDQRIVEAAELAWCLYIGRQYLWEPLSTTEKDQVADWLAKVNGKEIRLNNWVLFKVMVNVVLRALGQSHSEQEIQQGLRRVDDLYAGDGWYQDGLSESFDHYAVWMFHDFLLKFMLIKDALSPSDRQRHLERVELFQKSYQYFFAADGSYPCFGRSQAYRVAVTGPMVMPLVVGGETPSPGLSRRLASGNLKFFLAHGLLSTQGTPTLGFTRTFSPMLEGYACGGSPYWIGKAFYGLLVPPEHPFWTAVEEPLPVEQQDYSVAIPVAGLLLDGEKQGGQVQLINHKTSTEVAAQIERSEKKYGNFAYSSHFGYEATIHQGRYNYDSTMLLSADGKTFYSRHKPFHLQTRLGFGASFFLPFGDTKTIVYTNIILCNHFQIRVHWLVSRRSVEVMEGGYALGYDEGTPTIVSGPDWEFAGHGMRGSFIRRLVGYDHNIPAHGFGGTAEGNNVLHRYSVTPGVGLSYVHRQHTYILLATLVRGCVNGEQPEDLVNFVTEVVEHGLGWIIIRLQNGDTIFTQMGPLRDKTIQLNGMKISGRTTFARISAAGEVIAHYKE